MKAACAGIPWSTGAWISVLYLCRLSSILKQFTETFTLSTGQIRPACSTLD